MTQRSEKFEVLVDSTLDEVWALLTTSDGLASWFGTDASIELVVGGGRTISWGDLVRIDGRISEIGPGLRLRVVYLADEKETGAEEWLVASEGRMVRVTLINSMSDEGIDDWEGFYGDIRRGWRLFLASLRFALEEAVAPHRVVRCRYLPATGPKSTVRSRVESVLPSVVTPDMITRLDDPPYSLLVASADRSLLLDIEGDGPAQVLFVQAATHGEEDPEWIDRALSAFEL